MTESENIDDINLLKEMNQIRSTGSGCLRFALAPNTELYSTVLIISVSGGNDPPPEHESWCLCLYSNGQIGKEPLWRLACRTWKP